MSCAGLTLRDGERIEVEAGEVVIQGTGELLAQRVPNWMEVWAEELLEHRWRHPRAQAPWQRGKDCGDVHVALMV